MDEYKDKFEVLSHRLRGLPEHHKLSFFLSGLRDDIQLTMRMFRPPNLISTFSLAKIQEQNLILAKKTTRSGPMYSPYLGILKKPNL